MNHDYAIFFDDQRNLIGHAERERGSRYFRGTLLGEPFQCPESLLGNYVAVHTGHSATTCFIHEPVWMFGTVIA